jgi:hypothetical protein
MLLMSEKSYRKSRAGTQWTSADFWLDDLPSGYDEHSHGSHGPFIDGLPIKHDDFPWLC